MVIDEFQETVKCHVQEVYYVHHALETGRERKKALQWPSLCPGGVLRPLRMPEAADGTEAHIYTNLIHKSATASD